MNTQKVVDELKDRIENLKNNQTKFLEELQAQDNRIATLNNEIAKRDEIIAKYEDELVHLKAKMYDMICRQ